MNIVIGILLGVMVLGLIGRSDYIAAGAGILLILHLTGLQKLLPLIQHRALDFGVLLLVIAVLTPVACGEFSLADIFRHLFSPLIFCGIIGGALATLLNGHGVDLLKKRPELMIGLVIGNIIGVLALKGIPVGPLAAGGIAAYLYDLMNLKSRP